MTKAFEYRHPVGLEETNALGNVYFTAYLSWQGRCRELFLRREAPEVLRLLDEGLRLVTTHVSCDFYAELGPRDEVVVRMSLRELTDRTVAMGFDYFRAGDAGRSPDVAAGGGDTVRQGAEQRGRDDRELVARGRQEIACVRLEASGETVPTPVPEALRRALEPYRRS